MRVPETEAVSILGINKSAYKVRLSRAQKKIADLRARLLKGEDFAKVAAD